MAIVYLITNRVNGKRYVGKTVHELRKRWSQHKSIARKGKREGLLHRALRKYGEDAFTIEILATCDPIRLNDLEKHYIETFASHFQKGHGYNMTIGGDGGLGLPCTDRAKSKLREINLGKKMPPESIERTRQANIGKIVSADTRKKIGDANRGRKHSQEAIAKIVDTHKGSKRTEQTRDNLRKAFSSPEMRERQRQIALAGWEKRRCRGV